MGVHCQAGNPRALNFWDSEIDAKKNDFEPGHVIAGKQANCFLECKAENGEIYVPKSGHVSFDCRNPIPSNMYQTECYNSGLDKDDEKMYKQCVPDWLEQGLNLVDQSPPSNQTTMYVIRV